MSSISLDESFNRSVTRNREIGRFREKSFSRILVRYRPNRRTRYWIFTEEPYTRCRWFRGRVEKITFPTDRRTIYLYFNDLPLSNLITRLPACLKIRCLTWPCMQTRMIERRSIFISPLSLRLTFLLAWDARGL